MNISSPYLASLWEIVPFTTKTTWCIGQGRDYGASAFILCTCIWLFLSDYPLHVDLRDREEFLRTLKVQTRSGGERASEDATCRGVPR